MRFHIGISSTCGVRCSKPMGKLIIPSRVHLFTSEWIPDWHDPFVNLPFTHHNQFVRKHVAPPLRERIFHFSSVSVSMLKAKANSQCMTSEISSLQAVSALVWRCMTRARSAPRERNTSCSMAINNRPRLDPPLPSNYFGNCLEAVKATAPAGELLENEIGWVTRLLHEAVANHDDKAAHEFLESWVKAPRIYQMDQNFDPYSVMIGSSPRFNMYGNDFGLGKTLELRSRYVTNFIIFMKFFLNFLFRSTQYLYNWKTEKTVKEVIMTAYIQMS